MRYQGDITGLVETEQLFNFTNRWSVLGFIGTGLTYNIKESSFNTGSMWNFGGGFIFRSTIVIIQLKLKKYM